MVTFLLRQLDSSFHVQGRVEDDVTLVARALHYPFIPSKTAITAVGAPTTWPAILAMLLWLVEILRYDKELKLRDADGSAGLAGEAGAAGTPDYFWWYLRQAYTLFLAGEDERIERLEEEVAAHFDTQRGALTAELANEEAALAQLEEQLREIQGTQSVLPRLRSDVTDLGHDIATATKTELEMREFEAALSAKQAEVTAEKASAAAQLERSRHEVERIAQIVAQQELSVEDVRRMAGTKSALRERRDALATSRTAGAGEADRLRLELRRKLDGLQLRVKDYHDAARQLQIIPLGAKWSGNQDWSLRIDERALVDRVAANPSYGYADGDRRQAAYALLGCEDFKNGQKEWLRRLRAGLVANADKSRNAIRREADIIHDANERRSEASRAAEDASASAQQLEAAARREAEAGENRLRDSAAELARCEAARDERRSQLEAAQAAARELGPAVLGELAAAIRHMEASQQREREAVKDTASRMALRVVEHVQQVKAMLEHASAASIQAKNRQVVAEAEREARIRQSLGGGGGPSSSSSYGAGGRTLFGSGTVPQTPLPMASLSTPAPASRAVFSSGARALPLPSASVSESLLSATGALGGFGQPTMRLQLPSVSATATAPRTAAPPLPPQAQPASATPARSPFSPSANTRSRAASAKR